MSTPVGSTANVRSFVGHAGVARRDVTPPVGIRNRLWGLAETDVSEGIHRPLTLTAIALSNADMPSTNLSSRDMSDTESSADDTVSRPLLLLSLDGSWWQSSADEWNLRSAVLDAVGLEADQVLISLTHTHSGVTLGSGETELAGGDMVPAYLESLATAAVSASEEALTNLAPATLDWSLGSCRLAANRELDAGDRMLVGFNPKKVADDTVTIGRITNDDDTIIGTLVNYACHPTTLAWDNHLISPDYVGGMRQVIEDETRAPCAFLQGASGDLAPRHQYVGDVEVADRNGRSLGYAALAAMQAMPPAGSTLTLTGSAESGAPLAIWEPQPAGGNTALQSVTASVTLEAQKKPTLDQLRKRWKDIDPKSLEERLRRAKHALAEMSDDPTLEHPVWAWQIGDAYVIAHPGEAFSTFQENLRSRFADHPVVVMNLTNGPGSHYLPPNEVYERRGYAAWASKVAAGSLERLEEHATELLKGLGQDAA